MDFSMYDTEPRGWVRNWDADDEEEASRKAELEKTLPLLEPFTIWSDPSLQQDIQQRPRNLVVGFGRLASALLWSEYQLDKLHPVASIILPSVAMGGNKLQPHVTDEACYVFAAPTSTLTPPTSTSTTSTASSDVLVLVCQYSRPLPSLDSNLFAQHLISSIKFKKAVMLGTLISSHVSGECHTLVTSAWSKEGNSTPVSMLPTPNVVDGVVAAVLTQCQVEGLSGALFCCGVEPSDTLTMFPLMAWNQVLAKLQLRPESRTHESAQVRKDRLRHVLASIERGSKPSFSTDLFA